MAPGAPGRLWLPRLAEEIKLKVKIKFSHAVDEPLVYNILSKSGSNEIKSINKV